MKRASHAPQRALGEPVVRLENVSCEVAGGRKILDGIDLEVRRGECLLLAGRSGSGKTTITKCINGLIPSFEPGIELTGSVSVCGLNPAHCEMHELAERVGSVFQNPKSQFFNLTSNDELAFGLESRGVPASKIEERIECVVGALGAHRLLGRTVTEMSGGERQSLVFASVDVASPDVYVLDEPTANLDKASAEGMFEALKQVCKDKICIIVTHDAFISEKCDRVLHLNNKKVTG